MEQIFELDLFDNHMIIEVDNKKILVDTGCTNTFGNGKFSFLEREIIPATNFTGVSIDSCSQLLGYDLDVLMGMDVLSIYKILIDYHNHQMTVSDEELILENAVRVPIKYQMGRLLMQLSVKGEILTFALDTGAKISYIHHSITDGEVAQETQHDFHPYIGQFDTPIFNVMASIGDSTFPVRFGNLPLELELALGMINWHGVIGSDLFHAFTVLLDIQGGSMWVKRVV